jgi:hypothetical protein
MTTVEPDADGGFPSIAGGVAPLDRIVGSR